MAETQLIVLRPMANQSELNSELSSNPPEFSDEVTPLHPQQSSQIVQPQSRGLNLTVETESHAVGGADAEQVQAVGQGLPGGRT